MRDLVDQRLFGLALACEKFNDHDTLRADSLLTLAPGGADVTGRSVLAGANGGARWPARAR